MTHGFLEIWLRFRARRTRRAAERLFARAGDKYARARELDARAAGIEDSRGSRRAERRP